ncbi:MAG: peptidylprolyl isomerase [Chloroflexi bacterium]|nr:peptidylprolyl isomerase [Chloroflexota bacterium]
MTKQKKGGFSQRQAAVAQGRQSVAQRAALTRTAVLVAVVLIFVVLLFLFVRNWPVAEEAASEAGAEAAVSQLERASNWTTLQGSGVLAQVEPVERIGYYTAQPVQIIDPERQYEVIIQTEKGNMRVHLYADQAPVTVNNFVALALDGYYDGTSFHRVLDGFMAQGGDPSGTGMGGPGYSFADEFVPELTFNRRGLLAMANSGPATNGSQFFITFAPAEHLNGLHTIFGEVVEGDEVLDAIRRRDPASDPNEGDKIERIIVLESE